MSNKTNLKVTNVENFGIQRKMVSAITTESWETIPHVSYMYEPTVTKFFEEFKKLNMHRTGADKITFNTLMLRVIVEGLKAAPQMNMFVIGFQLKIFVGLAVLTIMMLFLPSISEMVFDQMMNLLKTAAAYMTP